MSNIELFKNCKVDNINRVSGHTALNVQNNYYDSLHAAGNGKKLTDAVFNKLGQPFLLNTSFDDIVEYTYGRVRLSTTGYWYYFGIDDFEVNTSGKTVVTYTLDPWETARCQMGAKLGRGVAKFSAAPPEGINIPQQSMQPHMINSSQFPLYKSFSNERFSLFVFYRDDAVNKSYIYYMTAKTVIANAEYIILGEWGRILNEDPGLTTYADTKVINAWLCPIALSAQQLVDGWTKVSPDNSQNMLYKQRAGTRTYKEYTVAIYQNLSSGPMHRSYVTDLRGSEVWSCPYGRSATHYKYVLEISPGSMKVIFEMVGMGTQGRFTIPCETIPLFSDAYNEYFARSRGTDMEMRMKEIDVQFWMDVANIAEGAVGGSIVGGMAGGQDNAGKGVGIGAAVGAAVSLVTTMVTNKFQKDVQPEFQAITDKAYRNQKDELSLVGSNVISIIKMYRGSMVVRETWDALSVERFQEMVRAIGYQMNYNIIDGHSFYTHGPLAGNFEIDGNIPSSWKGQIRERFALGVIIGDTPVEVPELPYPIYEDPITPPVDPTLPEPEVPELPVDPDSYPIGSYWEANYAIGAGVSGYHAHITYVKNSQTTGTFNIRTSSPTPGSYYTGDHTGPMIFSIPKIEAGLKIDFNLSASPIVIGSWYIEGYGPRGSVHLIDNEDGGYMGLMKESGTRLYNAEELDGCKIEIDLPNVACKFQPDARILETAKPLHALTQPINGRDPSFWDPERQLVYLEANGSFGCDTFSYNSAYMRFQETEPMKGVVYTERESSFSYSRDSPDTNIISLIKIQDELGCVFKLPTVETYVGSGKFKYNTSVFNMYLTPAGALKIGYGPLDTPSFYSRKSVDGKWFGLTEIIVEVEEYL